MGLQADGLQRWAVERLMEAKRSKSGGVWGLARFAGHAAADDQWVRLVDMSLPLRAEARGLLPLRRRRLLAVAPTVAAGVQRSGRAPGECSRSAMGVFVAGQDWMDKEGMQRLRAALLGSSACRRV